MRRADLFDKRAATLSVVLHGAVFALAWVGAMRHVAPMEFTAIQIDLVSPPPAAQAEEPQPAAERIVVERPREEPQPREPEPDIVPAEKPPPKPEPEPEPTPPAPEPEPEQRPEAAPAVTPEPSPTQRTDSGENINVRIEGLRRDYPAYYENIIRQINRCFISRWRQGGNWEAEVLFTIRKDGVASDLEFGKRSGNVSFDYEAMGAVDCAGQGRFGPLPEDFPWEAVRIRFTFEPPSEQ
jgi:outer membrane biosynthesis protein TonB